MDETIDLNLWKQLGLAWRAPEKTKSKGAAPAVSAASLTSVAAMPDEDLRSKLGLDDDEDQDDDDFDFEDELFEHLRNKR